MNNNIKNQIIVFFIIFFVALFLMLAICSLFFKSSSVEQIVKLSKTGCPNSKDMNLRFEKLYKRFGNGKSVPFIFIDGTPLVWEEIYCNMDHLLEDK